MIRMRNLKARVTGDTAPIKLRLTDASGTPRDITGFSFSLKVDASENPDPGGASNLFDIAGTIDDAADGAFRFPFTQPNANLLVPLAGDAAYHAWIKVTDASGYSETAKVRLPIAGGPG